MGGVELQQHLADPRARGRRDGRPLGPLRAPVRAARPDLRDRPVDGRGGDPRRGRALRRTASTARWRCAAPRARPRQLAIDADFFVGRRVRGGRDPARVRPPAAAVRPDPDADPARAAAAAGAPPLRGHHGLAHRRPEGRSTARGSASRRRPTGSEPSCSSPSGSRANRGTVYRLGPPSPVTQPGVQPRRHPLPHQPRSPAARSWPATRSAGGSAMPLLTLHTTGDGQVPIDQARHPPAPRRRRRTRPAAGAAGVPRPGPLRVHEHRVGGGPRGARPVGRARRADPQGTTCAGASSELRRRFELNPRPGTPEADAVPGARRRVVLHGRLTLDGRPFDARFLGAVVRRRTGLVAPCQLTLRLGPRRPLPDHGDGRTRRRAAAACAGARIALWTFAGDRILYSLGTRPWPRGGGAAADVSFSPRRAPTGPCRRGREFAGEVFTPDGPPAPGRDPHRRVRRRHALRRDVGPAHRKLLRLQPRRRRPGRDPGLHCAAGRSRSASAAGGRWTPP